ncbi:MAG: hypothetical protein J6I68_14800 [Butyrivibrio sp.]|uniref:hypothetical protein n=1 Tax=Butyrivibrio sp. TaxID=28121 RepID=UPI001B4644F7|nr:hypothetical protein [Butyrivibrio sp.]MBP3784512.1 hypothetical protein [Butyrivibrio sp.]
MDIMYFFQIFTGIIVIIALYEYLTTRYATFTHELNHYKEAYKRSKCDAIILLRTIFVSGRHEFKWKSNKVTVKLTPMSLWKQFEMKGALGRVYFSNEYTPYNNADLTAISRAGLHGSLKGYVVSSLLLGMLYAIFCLTVIKLPVMYAVACGLVVALTGYLSFSAIKTASYFAAGRKPGWSDRAIELNPDGYKEYLKGLEPNNLHTYKGISKMI